MLGEIGVESGCELNRRFVASASGCRLHAAGIAVKSGHRRSRQAEWSFGSLEPAAGLAVICAAARRATPKYWPQHGLSRIVP
jgi:hypothetical protein